MRRRNKEVGRESVFFPLGTESMRGCFSWENPSSRKVVSWLETKNQETARNSLIRIFLSVYLHLLFSSSYI